MKSKLSPLNQARVRCYVCWCIATVAGICQMRAHYTWQIIAIVIVSYLLFRAVFPFPKKETLNANQATDNL